MAVQAQIYKYHLLYQVHFYHTYYRFWQPNYWEVCLTCLLVFWNKHLIKSLCQICEEKHRLMSVNERRSKLVNGRLDKNGR